MRIARSFSVFLLVLLLLALPATAWAQVQQVPSVPPDQSQATATVAPTPPAPPTPPTPDQASAPAAASSPAAVSSPLITSGSMDFGFLASSVTGDAARYNRYRDLSNGGLVGPFRMEMDKANYFLNVGANEVARTDASYWANLTKAGTFKAGFLWDQIPDLVSTTTKSLFTEVSPGVLRVDPSVQTALQNAASTTPSTLAATLPAYLNNFAHEYDLGTNRHITSGSLQYLLSPDTTVNMDVSHTNRTGTVLYSGTFGFSNQVDVPEPISQHTTNTNMTFEHAAGDLLLRAGFTGTYFRNDLTTLTWDNPYRITDSATAPMQGRTALPPSNNWNVFNTSISWKLPKHTRLTGYVAFGFLDDNGAAIIPQTINTAIAVIPLARSTVQGQAQTQNMSLTFTSRPTKTMDVDVRYRYNNIDDLTPVYMNMSRVPYDSSVETGTAAAPLATASTDRYGIGRQTLDANVHVSMPGGSSMGVGYTGNRATYEDRIFASSVTNEEHISFDTLSMQYFSLHTNYAHSVRRGSGLDTSEIAYDGEQTSLRTYDIADVNSDLFTIAASLFPTSSLSVTFTAGDGQDQYPNTNLGVSNAKHYVYGVDLDLEPTNHVSVTAGYNLDDYNAIEWSRNAATTTAATFADPSKDWSDTNHDRVATVSGGLSFLHLNDKIDIRFGYNYNRSRGMYLYGLGSAPLDPTAATTLAAPVQLPTLVNDLTRGTFDVSYAFTPKVSFSFTYWYERYQVSDFALGASAIPNLNILTTDVLMGYQYLPYTANSFFGRLVCRF